MISGHNAFWAARSLVNTINKLKQDVVNDISSNRGFSGKFTTEYDKGQLDILKRICNSEAFKALEEIAKGGEQ